MSRMAASVTPTLDDDVDALAPVKVTEPKLVKATSDPFSSKSSTIHSAFCPARAAWWALSAIAYKINYSVTYRGRRSADSLGDGLPSGDILQDDCAGGGGGGMNSDRDGVASGDGEVGEVDGVVRVPFVPCLVRYLTAADGEINASLKNGVLGSVAVDSDPCRGRSGSSRGGNDKRPGHGIEGLASWRALQNGARPVGAV